MGLGTKASRPALPYARRDDPGLRGFIFRAIGRSSQGELPAILAVGQPDENQRRDFQTSIVPMDSLRSRSGSREKFPDRDRRQLSTVDQERQRRPDA